jgi:excinuclease ABC subunit A
MGPMNFIHPIKNPVGWNMSNGAASSMKPSIGISSNERNLSREHARAHGRIDLPCLQRKPFKTVRFCCKLKNKTIAEITAMSIDEAADFFKGIIRTKISEELLKEISERLRFLLGVGLSYITLERSSPTLSGGEAQRVRLASQIGSGLVSTTYVLESRRLACIPSTTPNCF